MQVLWELTEGKLGEAPLPPTGTAASIAESREPVAQQEADDDDEEDLTEMQSRLQALRS